MQKKLIEKLESIIGEDHVISAQDQLEEYLIDETPRLIAPRPNYESILLKPKNEKEISEILKLANEEKISVVPRGGGTGLCGAAIPTEPSIVILLERLNGIQELDRENLMIRCQAGVTLEKLFEAVEGTDLFFPPHPGDESAHIGGLVAENAGGARAVKYGVMREYVKGLKVIWPTGEISRLGGKILKNNSGYDLTHLLIGNEGTLGIISEITLRFP